jgi:hypothetical protein
VVKEIVQEKLMRTKFGFGILLLKVLYWLANSYINYFTNVSLVVRLPNHKKRIFTLKTFGFIKTPQESLNFQFLIHSKIYIGKYSLVNIECFFATL